MKRKRNFRGRRNGMVTFVRVMGHEMEKRFFRIMQANRHRYDDFIEAVVEVNSNFDKKGQVDVRVWFIDDKTCAYFGIKSTVPAFEARDKAGAPQLLVLESQRDETIFQNTRTLISDIYTRRLEQRRRPQSSGLIAQIALDQAARQAQAYA